MNPLNQNPSTIIYSSPFTLHCRGTEIGPPDNVDLETFGTLEENLQSSDVLVVDLLVNPYIEENPEWFPSDHATITLVEHLEEVLIPHLENGGVVIILPYDSIDIQDGRVDEEVWKSNRDWFKSHIQIDITATENQTSDSDSVNKRLRSYFNFVQSIEFILDLNNIPSDFVELLAKTEKSEPIAVAVDHYKDRNGSWREIAGRVLFLPRPTTLRYNFENIVQNLVDIGYSYVPKERKYQYIDEKTAPDYSGEQSVHDRIELVLSRFPIVARQLEHRYNDRDTLSINDEYDVQDLLHGLLRLFFQDVRPEEYSPSYAGTSPRIDFLLKDSSIGIEVKIARKNHRQQKIKEELAIDKDHYQSHPDCETLFCFVYDPEFIIENPNGFQEDISEITSEFETKVYVYPTYE